MEEIQWIDHRSSRVNKSVTRWIAAAAKNIISAISAEPRLKPIYYYECAFRKKAKAGDSRSDRVVTPD
jgi:hypothetical protein